MVLEYKLHSPGLTKFNSQSGEMRLSTKSSKMNFSPFFFLYFSVKGDKDPAF